MMAQRILVMYAGRIVEAGATEQILTEPQHPYTQDLLASAPSIDGDRVLRLPSVDGQVPAVGELPTGCPYHTRCAYSDQRCATEFPPRLEIGGCEVLCWHPASSRHFDTNPKEASPDVE
jgi:oligopeptide/dipeptide ABC transporter ATP-binding protein